MSLVHLVSISSNPRASSVLVQPLVPSSPEKGPLSPASSFLSDAVERPTKRRRVSVDYSSLSEQEDDDDEEEDRYVGRFYRARGGSGDASNPGSVSHSNSGSFASGMRRRPGVEALTSANGAGSANGNQAGNEVPAEYKAEVDRVFFEFLNKICSNRT